MKRFPFKVLFLCVLLPPLAYILTLQGLEGWLKSRETAELNGILIQNQEALFEGRYSVREEVNRNIEAYLRHNFMYSLGIQMSILVKTRDGHILYPGGFQDEGTSLEGPDGLTLFSRKPLDYTEVAAENYRILNDGLVLSVDLRIKHNSWLSNGVLVLYVLTAALILRAFIRKGMLVAEKQAAEQEKMVRHLSEQLKIAESNLSEVKAHEKSYQERIDKLREDKEGLSKDIDGLLEEMEKLEAGLESQKRRKEEMENQVRELREELLNVKEKSQKPKKRKKKSDITDKRFRVLYKNLAFTERALEGFASLPEEVQIKAEEIIHKLNEDDSAVPVKRKVFGKRGKMNILETEFAYSGRLYFQKNSDAKITVVAVGTKNTQDKDLAFLENFNRIKSRGR